MDIYDFFAVTGLLLLVAGLFFIYWPLALIVPGAFLLWLGVRGAAAGE